MLCLGIFAVSPEATQNYSEKLLLVNCVIVISSRKLKWSYHITRPQRLEGSVSLCIMFITL